MNDVEASQLPYNSQDSLDMKATGAAEMAEVNVIAHEKSAPDAGNGKGTTN